MTTTGLSWSQKEMFQCTPPVVAMETNQRVFM